ncbi:MAG: hypothetical protein ACYTFI_24875 [Planctomycetota bacterium]|jgi:hypothetical protein
MRAASVCLLLIAAGCAGGAMVDSGDTPARAQSKPFTIYILAGQSNMQGHARVETSDYIGDGPAAAPLLEDMRGPHGKPRVCEKVDIRAHAYGRKLLRSSLPERKTNDR